MMFDSKDGYEYVDSSNEELYRRAFALNVGHSEECIKETVDAMAEMLKKVCAAFGGIPIEGILDQMSVEEFDHHLRRILESKECKCKK